MVGCVCLDSNSGLGFSSFWLGMMIMRTDKKESAQEKRDRIDRLLAQWVVCEKCGYKMHWIWLTSHNCKRGVKPTRKIEANRL